jgi:hypothetical protein
LQAFFDQRYRRSVRHFAAADALQPGFSDVKRMLEDARSRPTPIPWAWLASGVTIASLGVFGLLWGQRWRRNRFRIAPSEVVRLMEESPETPLILDVRSASVYAKSPLRIPNAIHVTPEELASGQSRMTVEPGRTVIAYCT